MNNMEKNCYVKTQILNTLLEMMKKQPFDSIVISTLCKNAQVGRASFYRNYVDLKDVLKKESLRLIKSWGGSFVLDGSDNISVTLISLLDYMKKHSEFYLNLYKSGLENIVEESIISLFPISEELPNATAYLTSSIGYMTYGWIHEWIKRGMIESGSELAKLIETSQKQALREK